MDLGRQVFRFSIPGSILLLWAAVGVVFVRLASGASFTATTAPIRENAAALVALVAAVPMGFLVYQAYYVFYRPLVLNWPMVWSGRWIRLDRASQVLARFSDEQVAALRELFNVELEITKPHERETARIFRWLRLLKLSREYVERYSSPSEARQAYAQRWYTNWDVLRAVIDISEASEATRAIKREYTHLSDVYHALGASRTAVWAGWVFTVGTTAATTIHLDGNMREWLIAVGLFSVATAAMLAVLHQTRRQTWVSASKSLHFQLRWIFENHPELFEPAAEGHPGLAGPLRKLRQRVSDAVSSDGPTT